MLKESDFYQVMKTSMHNTHKEEIDILNKIISSFNKEEELIQNLDELLEHTINHFGKEDELMNENGFPMIQFHSMEHKKGIENLRKNIEIFKETKNIDKLKEYITIELVEWTKNHIMSMDKITASFLETGEMGCNS